jgi:succinate-semialdehyde dehydrogenase/glutarate-semialdehyde dehydrogenase
MTEAEVLADVPKDLLIGGEWRPGEGGERLAVEDPATGETLCEVADGSVADAKAALDAASGAQAEWAAHPPRERGEILRRAFELIAQRTDRAGVVDDDRDGQVAGRVAR